MKFSFQITQPPDKYESGTILWESESAAEVFQILKKDKALVADPERHAVELAEAICSKRTVTWHDKSPHFLIESTLGAEATAPYLNGLERLTGAPIPELITANIDVLQAFADQEQLTVTKAVLEDGCLSFAKAQEDVYRAHSGYGEKTLDESFQYAEKQAFEELKERLGYRPYEKEFVGCGQGQYRRNPRYATGHKLPVEPCIGYPKLWDLLLMWWKDNVATPLQKAALEELIEIEYGTTGRLLSYCGEGRWYPDITLYLPDSGGSCHYGSGRVPTVRIVKDLSEESLKGWTPGVNILPIEEKTKTTVTI